MSQSAFSTFYSSPLSLFTVVFSTLGRPFPSCPQVESCSFFLSFSTNSPLFLLFALSLRLLVSVLKVGYYWSTKARLLCKNPLHIGQQTILRRSEKAGQSDHRPPWGNLEVPLTGIDRKERPLGVIAYLAPGHGRIVPFPFFLSLSFLLSLAPSFLPLLFVFGCIWCISIPASGTSQKGNQGLTLCW